LASLVNTEFQDDNLNDNEVPYASVLLNLAVESFRDPGLISNGISNGSGANSSYQMVGVDASPDRTSKELFGFNYFLRGEEVTTSIPGDRRRVVVLNGSTGEVLLNESASTGAAQSASVIAAINSVEMEPEESFALWILESAVSETERGENDDPDGDCLTNLLEYALGLDPAVADAGNGPRIEMEPEGLRLVFQRSKTAAVDPIVIESGSSLGGFSAYVPAPEDFEVSDQGETERVSVIFPEGDGKSFARLKVSAQ